MKKVLSILAASAMLAIVACGGETKPAEAPATEATATEEVAVDTAAMAVDTTAMPMDTTAAPAN